MGKRRTEEPAVKAARALVLTLAGELDCVAVRCAGALAAVGRTADYAQAERAANAGQDDQASGSVAYAMHGTLELVVDDLRHQAAALRLVARESEAALVRKVAQARAEREAIARDRASALAAARGELERQERLITQLEALATRHRSRRDRVEDRINQAVKRADAAQARVRRWS